MWTCNKKLDKKKYLDFDKHNYTTWHYCHLPTYQESMKLEILACGDLLANLNFKKPPYLEFVNCEQNPKTQYITRVEYRVPGKYSEKCRAVFHKTF